MNRSQKIIFSIIVPAYNEEKCLANCLKSIFKQNFPKDQYEVIVVNNASTDKTYEIANKFPVKIINEPKKGIIFAKQAGCLKAKGDIIAITDADTQVPQFWLSHIYDVLSANKYIAITGPAVPQPVTWWSKIFYFSCIKILLFLAKKDIVITMHGQNVAFWKKYFLRFGGFNTRLSVGEDELGLLAKLKKFGKVHYSSKLRVKTSARRYNKGPLVFAKEMLWNYFLGFNLGKLLNKTIIPPYPDIRL